MCNDSPLNLVIVGHVDHGKSTLIGRLLCDTGSLPPETLEALRRASGAQGRDVEFAHAMDHLAEERADAMTIDTAQAFFRSPRREVVIIDAPGHRELTRNMVTGASQAEAAVLVVDATEGLREQTRRHAYLLALLGIGQVAVLINKMDRVGYRRDAYARPAEATRRFLESVGVAPTHLVPGSAMKGDNIALPSVAMPWYAGPTLLEALDTFEPVARGTRRPLRLPVQDIYDIDGAALLAGRVESGAAEVGQELVFLPSGGHARITGLEVLGSPSRRAETGQCVGITIEPPLVLARGEVACALDDAPPVTRRLRASLFWMDRKPCRAGECLDLRAGTLETPCRLAHIERRINSSTLEVIEEDADEVAETEVARVVLEAERPLVVETFGDLPELGRLVVMRDCDIVGGGLVTRREDVHAT